MKIREWIEKYKSKRIFQSMFMTCFGLASACILFVCIGGFVWFRNSELEKEKQTAENTVKMKALMLSEEMNAIEDAMEVLRNDTYVNQSFVKRSNQWDETMNIASKSVLNMISSNPALHSIYAFKNGEYMIKTSNPAYPMNMNGDRMMNEIFYNSSFGTLEYHYYMDLYGVSRCLFTLSDGEKNPSLGEPEKGILIGMDIGRWMEDSFDDLRPGEQYLISDKDGNIVYQKGGLLENQTNLFEVLTIDQKKTEEAIGLEGGKVSFDGISYEMTLADIGNEYWLIQLLPYSYLVESIVQLRDTFIFIVIFLGILVLLLAFAMSTWVYSPIEAVVKTTGGMEMPSESMYERLGKTELSSIVNTYHTMMDHLNHMNVKKEQEELAEYLCDKKGQIVMPEWLWETYGKEGIFSRVLCMRINEIRDNEMENTEEAELFEKQTIINIAEQILKPLGSVLVSPVTESCVAVLLFTEESLEEGILMEKVREIHNVARELLHVGINTGISNQQNGFEELSALYQMARAATAYRFLYGDNSVILETQMTKQAFQKERQTNIDISAAIQAVKEERREDFWSEYDWIVENLRNRSIQEARETILSMGAELLKYENSLNYKYAPLTALDYETLNGELSKFEYIDDLKDWFSTITGRIWLLLGQAKQTGREDIIQKVLFGLNEKYADPNISAQLLADQYHITPSYFSRLFHERTGYAFPDYLAKIRLDHAKELLLKKENKSIQEICKEVGYTNPSYFTAIFKKNLGLTPGQFRKNQQNSKN